MQKRIEVLGVEVGFYHAHVKGVDWVRRPWEPMTICLHSARMEQPSTVCSRVLLMHWRARLPVSFRMVTWVLVTCLRASFAQPCLILCRYLWTTHHISGWAVCMRMPLACMATTRHGAPCLSWHCMRSWALLSDLVQLAVVLEGSSSITMRELQLDMLKVPSLRGG